MAAKLAGEIMDAANERGAAIKKKRILTGWPRLIRPLLIIVGEGVINISCSSTLVDNSIPVKRKVEDMVVPRSFPWNVYGILLLLLM